MRFLITILGFSILVFTIIDCHGQTNTIDRTAGPQTVGNIKKGDYFIVLDGIPIYKIKKTIELFDTCQIDSIIIHKRRVENKKGKLIYNAFIEFRTIDSINQGLKYIQKETNNWTFENPLAGLFVNNRKLNWIEVFDDNEWTDKPGLIKKIDIIQPDSLSRKNQYGNLYIIINE